jgi:hypothetical protein
MSLSVSRALVVELECDDVMHHGSCATVSYFKWIQAAVSCKEVSSPFKRLCRLLLDVR